MDLASFMGLVPASERALEQTHTAEVTHMRRELQKKTDAAFYQEAYKKALADVLNEMVAELLLEQAGALKCRVLTDPKNAEGRNEAYAHATARHLEEMSGGRIIMNRASIDKIKNTGRLK